MTHNALVQAPKYVGVVFAKAKGMTIYFGRIETACYSTTSQILAYMSNMTYIDTNEQKGQAACMAPWRG